MLNKAKLLRQYKNLDVESQVFSATPHKRVSLLYEGAIRFTRQARLALENRNYEAKGVNTSRLMDIVSSLRAGLDHEKGGELSRQLDAIYAFILKHALDASKELDVQKYRDIEDVLGILKDGWDNMPEKYRMLDDGALEKLRAEAG
ncbi:flagellar export chaperone FliS [Candidatus Parcubacteria bacterium]|nr:MAG: flagellar export chaperone FliS [Candidatus Parcubacteria bacterium]